MKEEYFISKYDQEEDIYRWTLTTKLGEILRDIEHHFGERDKSYTLLGVEFREEGTPFIWYPGNCKNIAIVLNADALDDEAQALYQLSHECVHLLSPTGGQNANILEEGLATYYSKIYTYARTGQILNPSTEKYAQAQDAVNKLLKFNFNIIKELRVVEPTISNISFELLRSKASQEITDEEIEYLVRPFNHN